MSQALDSAFRTATTTATGFTLKRMGGGSASNNIFGGMGTSAMEGPVRTPSMNHHLEQYKHFRGWVHAAIRPIAQTIAKQQLRIARIKRVANQAATPVTAKGYIYTPSGPIRRDRAALHLHLKRTMPSCYKEYAETAEILETHPMLDALNNPNDVMVRWTLMYVTSASLELTGKAYWWVRAEDDPKAPNGKRIVIWPLPSHWVTPKHDDGKIYSSWDVRPDGVGKPFNLPLEQVVYFYLPNPASPFGSHSTLQSHAPAVVCDESISESQRQAFQRGIFPGYAVVVGRMPDAQGNPGQGERPVLTGDQRRQLTLAIKQMYRGAYNYDEPLILDAMIEDVRRLTTSNREMDWTQSGVVTKERITQGFGTNPIVMGQVEGANRATAATAKDIFYDLAVNPKIELMSQGMTRWFNPIFAADDEMLILYLEEAVASDPDSDRASWTLLAEKSACDRDELRAGLLNLPPLDSGGDLIPVPGGVSFMPINNVRDTTPAAPPMPSFLATVPVVKEGEATAMLLGDPPPWASAGDFVLPVPNVEQSLAYDCGAAASRAVAEHYRMVHEWSEDDFINALVSDDVAGTEPRHIVGLFKHNGCMVQYGPHWNRGRLEERIKNGYPVICCIQGLTFGDDEDREQQQNGHWVVADQVTSDGVGYMDPATGNHEFAPWQTWLDNWRDRGSDGTPYNRYGIAVGPPPQPIIDPVTGAKPSRKGYFCVAKVTPIDDRIKARSEHADRWEARVAKRIMEHYTEQRNRILDDLMEWSKSVDFTGVVPLDEPLPEFGLYDYTHKTEADWSADKLLDRLVPVKRTTRLLAEAVGAGVNEAILASATLEWNELQPTTTERAAKPDRTPLPKPIRATCQDYVGRIVVEPYWEDMTYKLRLQMARAIRLGIAKGETKEEIMDRILDVVSPENDATRSMLIARTESTGAINVAQHAVREHLVAQGHTIMKRWVALKKNTRQSHLDADEQTVKNKNKFRVGGVWCMYPGDQSLPPKERCNCQCTALSVPM